MHASAHENREADHLSPRAFQRLASLIQQYSGIKMPPSKQTMLEGRLRRRINALEMESMNAYVEHLYNLDGQGFEDELIELINLATTNKTDFFREPAHFDFVQSTILPDVLASGRRKLTAWSAAASMGAEAYTLAMVVEEFRRDHHGFDYEIIATDICSQVLQKAHQGLFPSTMIDPVPVALRRRYVMMSKDPQRQEVRISPQIRSKIAFARLNLMDETYPITRDLDVIFCRNILIYFEKSTQERVLERLCRHLRTGGYLILGHSESAVGADLPVKAVCNTIFQRI